MNDLSVGARIQKFIERVTKAEGHWSKQPRWPAGMTIGGQFKAWDADGVLIPPQVGGGASNPQYQAKADGLYKMFKAGEVSIVQTAVATLAEKAAQINAKPKKSSHDNWNLSVLEYGKALLAEKQAKESAEISAFKIHGVSPLSDYTYKGPKPGGSNPGGVYSKGGKDYLIKGNAKLVQGAVTAKQSDDRAKNEVLAAKLMQEAGVSAPNMELVSLDGKYGGGLGVASEMMSGLTGFDPKNPAHKAAAQSDFAVHAWLANYDAVGMSFDNLMMTKDGKAANIDPGGALLFRAQGLPKEPLSTAVTEIDSMRDPVKNHSAAAVYGSMTQSQIAESVKKVSSITDATIKSLVMAYAPGTEAEKAALADKLIERKKWLEAQAKSGTTVPGQVSASGAQATAVPKYKVGSNGGVSTNGPGGFTAFVNDNPIGLFPSMATAGDAVKAHPDYVASAAAGAGSATMTTLHNTEPGHNKFYQVIVDGTTVKTVWGKIGTIGQTQNMVYATPELAKLAAAAKIAEKTGKGYVHIDTKSVGSMGASSDQSSKEVSVWLAAVHGGDLEVKQKTGAGGQQEFNAYIDGKLYATTLSLVSAQEKVMDYASAMSSASAAGNGSPGDGEKFVSSTIHNGVAIKVTSTGKFNQLGGQKFHVYLDGKPFYQGPFNTATEAQVAAVDAAKSGPAPAKVVIDYAAMGALAHAQGIVAGPMANPNFPKDATAKDMQAYVDAWHQANAAAGQKSAPSDQGSGTIVGYTAVIAPVPKISSPSNPNTGLAAQVANIAAYAQDVISGKMSPEKGVQAINSVQIAGSNNYSEKAKLWQEGVALSISNANPVYSENPYKPGSISSALYNATVKVEPATVGPSKVLSDFVLSAAGNLADKGVILQSKTFDKMADVVNHVKEAINEAYSTNSTAKLKEIAQAISNRLEEGSGYANWSAGKNIAVGKELVKFLNDHVAHIDGTSPASSAPPVRVMGATASVPAPSANKPKFFDTKFASAKEYYENHANELEKLAQAGASSQAIKDYVAAHGGKAYSGNLGKESTPNGKLINGYVAALVAAAEAKEAKATVQAVNSAQEALSQPAAAVPAPGNHVANNAAMPSFDKAKLPETNTNASSHNAKIDKLKELAEKGDVKGILSLKFGTNNYAKKQVQVANNVLSALGYALTVTPGQKTGSHPALTAGFTPAQAAAAFKSTGAQPSAIPGAHHGPVDNKGKPIVIKPDTFPTPPDFKNWSGQGKGLSSKDWVNQQNQDIVNGLLEAAKSLDEASVKAFVFEKLTPEGKPTGTFAPLSDHPSKHTKEYQLSLLATIDDLKNPPEPLKHFAGASAATIQAISNRFPSKAHGQTPHTVKKNEQFGFWIALGKVDSAEKFKPTKEMKLSQSAIAAGHSKYKTAPSSVKKFISGMQSNVTSFSSLYAEPGSANSKYDGFSPSQIAKDATAYATAHPAGTQIFKWINFPKNMLAQIEKAEVGLVFDSVKPMCCSYHPTATSGFGTHLLRITFADGAKGVDTFGSGHYSGEMEVSTLPHNRFMITGKKWTGHRWELDVLMLPPDPEVYK